jgi:hypothetical protein
VDKRLEEFIRSNREAFDSEEPASYIERMVVRNREPKKARVLPLLMKRAIAIAAILILAVGIYFYKTPVPETTTTVAGAPPKPDLIQEISPEKAKQVAHFSATIQEKRIAVSQVKNDNPQLYGRFSNGLQNLDSIYRSLEKELEQTPNPEILLEAMIQNLRLQTELLNRQLEIIQKLQKTKTHESKTI